MSRIPQEKLRVNMLDVGGAFGARTAPFPEYPLLLHAAKQHRAAGEVAVPRGRRISLPTITAARSRSWANWPTTDAANSRDTDGMAVQLRRLLGASRRAHKFDQWQSDRRGRVQGEAFYGRHRQVMTNTSPTNAYRGAGRPEANLPYRATGRRSGGEAQNRSRWNCAAAIIIAADAMPYETADREAASTAATSRRCSRRRKGSILMGEWDLAAGGSNRRKTASCAAWV